MHNTQGLCIILCMAELRIPVWTLGDRLRKARENAELSIQEMADLLGVHRNTVTGWESDKPIKRGMVRAWADHCGVTLEWLETGTLTLNEPAVWHCACDYMTVSQDPLPFPQDDDGDIIDLREHILNQTTQNDSLDLYAPTG